MKKAARRHVHKPNLSQRIQSSNVLQLLIIIGISLVIGIYLGLNSPPTAYAVWP